MPFVIHTLKQEVVVMVLLVKLKYIVVCYNPLRGMGYGGIQHVCLLRPTFQNLKKIFML